MAKNIEPKLKAIGEYLQLDQKAIFVIPEYQRAYSWEIGHCDKLWQDIEAYEAYVKSGGNDRYFFGTVIISCEENDTQLNLIDGQQRTTTFLLLMKALLLRINSAISESNGDEDSESLIAGLTGSRNKIMSILYKAEDEDIPGLLKDSNMLKDEKRKVLENHANNEIYRDELSVIISAPDFDSAESSVAKIKYKQKDNKYTNYFRNFKFYKEKLEKLGPSQVNVFAKNITKQCEIIEIRSWQIGQAIDMFNSLNSVGMPLLDADIISAQLYSESVKLIKSDEFNIKWRNLLTMTETLGVVDLDAILMQYMYISRARKREYISESGSISVTTPGLRRYYTEINQQMLKDPIALSDELLKISEIWGKIKDYTIIKLLLKFNDNVKLYISGFLSRFTVEEITEEKISIICEFLLKLFAIMELVDIGYSSSKFKTFLFGEMLKLIDSNISIRELEDDFKAHIAENWKENDISEKVAEYDKNILVFLNEYLFAKSKELTLTLTDKEDIEHIMPGSGKNLSEIRKDAGINDEIEFSNLVNKLGNKILLEDKVNRSIGNEWFRTKIQTSVTAKSGYKDSRFAIANALVEHYKDVAVPYWSKDDINNATTKISQRISSFIFSK